MLVSISVFLSGAHPRSRGENALGVAICGVVTGSSPLTRGKPRQCRRAPSRLRLIPAHAGKTARSGTRRRRAGAHPRSRGENGAARRIGTAAGGSSPLTRGKLVVMIASVLASGLIPAHAGKTSARAYQRACYAAHPRSRGENFSLSSSQRTRGGSSPLTRGKPEDMQAAKDSWRLIPAHAGKTPRCDAGYADLRAHPRSRGENGLVCACHVGFSGSSPLTRGKLVVITLIEIQDGLIPAHAGKTPRDGP